MKLNKKHYLSNLAYGFNGYLGIYSFIFKIKIKTTKTNKIILGKATIVNISRKTTNIN